MVDYTASDLPLKGAEPGATHTLVRNVGGITALLAGMIALARIPRITRSRGWIGIALGIFAGGSLLYANWVSAEVRQWHALRIFASRPVTGLLRGWAISW